MTEPSPNEEFERKFRVTTIEKTEPPEGVEGGEWYHYVIDHHASKIEGKRSGTLQSVRSYVEEYADNLNQRATLGYSAYAARKVKK